MILEVSLYSVLIYFQNGLYKLYTLAYYLLSTHKSYKLNWQLLNHNKFSQLQFQIELNCAPKHRRTKTKQCNNSLEFLLGQLNLNL